MRGPDGKDLILGVAALAMVAVSCSSSTTAPTPPGTVRQGGDITLSAQREPDCMDWIGACAGVDWGVYTVQTNTMPRAYDYTQDGYKPSSLLTGPAQLQTTPMQVVTYHINPKAVWADGRPISAHDFEYTWDQIAHGQNIYSPAGYDLIKSVDDTDPHTVVVTYASPYPDWKMLFGGYYGILPSHLLEGKDRDSVMRDGYTFSGGPWKLDHWTKGTELKLVPNSAFWGKKPNLNSVTFKFIPDPVLEKQAYQSGDILGMYPQAEPGVETFKGIPGTYFDAVTGLSYEGLWLNVQKAPLNSKAVRQALAYATDREAIVRQLFSSTQPSMKPINSTFTPAFGSVYTEPFAKYHLDLSMVTQLMKSDGWAKGSDGIWAKAGTKATLELKTTIDDSRRQAIATMVQTQWQAAGFQLSVNPEKAGVLFGQDLPAGNFSVGLYAQSATDNDPGECVFWCSKNIPTQVGLYNGQNFDRINDPNLDKPWSDADSSLDDSVRIADAQSGQMILAELVPVIPLEPLPDILVINTDKLGIEGGNRFPHNLAYGPFADLNTWYAK